MVTQAQTVGESSGTQRDPILSTRVLRSRKAQSLAHMFSSPTPPPRDSRLFKDLSIPPFADLGDNRLNKRQRRNSDGSFNADEEESRIEGSNLKITPKIARSQNVRNSGDDTAAKKRATEHDPNDGCCLVTGVKGYSTIMNSCHLLPAIMNNFEIRQLNWAWGHPPRELNINTHKNRILLGESFHGTFDDKRWFLIPPPEIIAKLYGYAKKVQKLDTTKPWKPSDKSRGDVHDLYDGQEVFEYYFVPNHTFRADYGIKKLYPDGSTQDHEFPFSTVGPLTSHVTPHFVVVNLALKLQELDLNEVTVAVSRTLEISQEVARSMVLDVTSMCRIWMNLKIPADFVYTPAPEPEGQDDGSDPGDRGTKKPSKKPSKKLSKRDGSKRGRGGSRAGPSRTQASKNDGGGGAQDDSGTPELDSEMDTDSDSDSVSSGEPSTGGDRGATGGFRAMKVRRGGGGARNNFTVPELAPDMDTDSDAESDLSLELEDVDEFWRSLRARVSNWRTRPPSKWEKRGVAVENEGRQEKADKRLQRYRREKVRSPPRDYAIRDLKTRSTSTFSSNDWAMRSMDLNLAGW